MKMVILGAVASAFLAAMSAAPAAYAGAQQDRMKQCNADAGDKKGDERKAFMKSCLSNKAAEDKSAKTAQQEKMKACNKDAGAKKLKGDERKAFMSTCLKG